MASGLPPQTTPDDEAHREATIDPDRDRLTPPNWPAPEERRRDAYRMS